METTPETLATVRAIIMENGYPFFAKVIGLSHFRVPEEQAIREGFLLAATSKN
jgi:hypothetical protein